MPEKWTDARKDALRTMWKAGATSTEIARELGGVTRNAVMGMVDRLGLMRDAGHLSSMKRAPTGCCAPKDDRRDASPQPSADHAATPVAARVVDDGARCPDADDAARPEPVGAFGSVPTVRVLEAGPEVAVEADAPAGPPPGPAPDVVSRDAGAASPSEGLASSGVAEEDEAEAIDEEEEVDGEISDEASDDVPALDRDGSSVRGAANDLARLQLIREAARSVRRHPSSRPWEPTRIGSRMPPSRRDLPPPKEVSISSGVMARASSAGRGSAEWRDAFSLLEQLTGVPYDDRVPGHVPALVAIATVLAKGDPRSVLSPKLPEQSVLRIMRSFAERGAVVAGKPPARWLQDVDDRVFYDEMLSLDAA